MTEHTNTTIETAATSEAELTEIRVGRLDDAHLAWFIAESECEKALRAWCAGADADIAYCSYLAALKREESAARHLERAWRASECPTETLVQRMHDVIH